LQRAQETLAMRLPHCAVLMLVLGCSGFGCRPRTPGAESTAGGEKASGAREQTPPAAASSPAPEVVMSAAANVEPEVEPLALQIPPYAAVTIQEVKDYDAWRPGFDAQADARKAASLVGEGVMRGVDDDDTVLVWTPATDLTKAKAFFADAQPAKKKRVERAPTVYLFRLLAAKMIMEPEGDVYSAIVKYSVKDFAAFKTAIERADAARNAAGVLGWGIGQDVDKTTVAYLYLQSSDPAKLKAYLDAKKTKAAMKKAGVKGEPKITLVREISNRMYE
jgi:quinol monooxygenase YgiN